MPEAVTGWLLKASGIVPKVPRTWPQAPMTVPAVL
jgi:hypothetical protein